MAVYLTNYPPNRPQFRRNRRAAVTGGIVVHTAENRTDTSGTDNGAENVARFISNRTDAAGSYHTIVDTDSIVRLCEYSWEAFGEGTGGNRWALHLAFACQATQWPTLPDTWVTGAMAQGAAAAADMAAWVNETRGVVVPAKRITADEYRAGVPGFISHAELDPGRRSDPGTQFPWNRFLALFAEKMGDPMPVKDPNVVVIQQSINAVMRSAKRPESELLVEDGDLGPVTVREMQWVTAHSANQNRTIGQQHTEILRLGGAMSDLGGLVQLCEASNAEQERTIGQQHDEIGAQNQTILENGRRFEEYDRLVVGLRAELAAARADCPECVECPELECPEYPDCGADAEVGAHVRALWEALQAGG